MKRFATTLLASTAAIGAILASAPSASAESNTTTYSGCRGTLSRSVPITSAGGTVLSRVQIWEYGSARLSEVCVKNVHVGSTVGKSLWTMVSIGSLYDRGDYSQYAGAIRTSGDWNGSYDIHVGGANPANPDRDYYCRKVDGRIGDRWAPNIWLCYVFNSR
ncbi:hypothetical protein GCM10022415_11230 [Knoellia locipacati]|uniref:Secreted protein n=1 Tax=Knoellia locipacati TaxID=882824 RepID=A0A512SYS6_9MICO|nr:hypothetical protein [Knoellia locipacati]GEQ13074.1 hypothetical protein KLO01_11210 [Knoellia locipacati]